MFEQTDSKWKKMDELDLGTPLHLHAVDQNTALYPQAVGYDPLQHPHAVGHTPMWPHYAVAQNSHVYESDRDLELYPDFPSDLNFQLFPGFDEFGSEDPSDPSNRESGDQR
jgi:hypothetical protein